MVPAHHFHRFQREDVGDIVEAVRRRVEEQPNATALIVETPTETRSISYAGLWREAERCCAGLRARGAFGDRVVLAFPAGEDFVIALFGCFLAGMIAAPSPPPKPGRPEARLATIVEDCEPIAVLTTPALAAAATSVGAPFVALSELDAPIRLPAAHRHPVAFLQYTSGSTGDPKGVIVTHEALWANEAVIRTAFAHAEGMTLVGWLPNHHDMGLVGNLLQPLYCGGTSVILSPQQFLKRPMSWLHAISRHRAYTSGAPNFAYDLCVRAAADIDTSALDLSSWKVAFNGAEPVRAGTMRRFAERFAGAGFDERAVYPCYGLAESTLMVTGGNAFCGMTVRRFSRMRFRAGSLDLEAGAADDTLESVACGRPRGAAVAIMDPSSGEDVAAGAVGEIWTSGPSLALGYWEKPAETALAFPTRFDRRWVRTGDLGALVEGELHVVGRRKDVIVLQGQNTHPSDIEHAVAARTPEALPGGVAAFGVCTPTGEEVVVLLELERGMTAEAGLAIAREARIASATAVGAPIAAVIALAPGAIPRTSSGKPRRGEARRLFLYGELKGVIFSGGDAERLRAAALAEL